MANGGGHVVTTSKLFLEKSLLISTRFYLPALSTVPDSFYYRFGLLADPTVRVQVDGVYFEYSHDINGGQWFMNVYKGGVLVQNLTLLPVAINTTYVLSILYRPGNGVVFSINGNDVAFVPQVNLPVVLLQYANGIRKYSGAASRSVFIDTDLLVYNMPV